MYAVEILQILILPGVQRALFCLRNFKLIVAQPRIEKQFTATLSFKPLAGVSAISATQCTEESRQIAVTDARRLTKSVKKWQ